MDDIRKSLGLRPVINVAGTMTSLGGSIARPEVIRAVAAMLPHFVEIDDLQRKASQAIARATGAEAGCVTASASAGVTIAIAGAMTGANLARIERLPDTRGMKDEVIVQIGHLCHYSAPIDQAVRLAGARLKTIGSVNESRPDQLEEAIGEATAAVLHVVSHQTMQYGQIALADVARVAHAGGVPVIVDAAAEYDLRGFLAAGADLAIYSAHKFLGGMTGGILAGAKPLVRAAYLQSFGIGRGMKVGKEGIAGVIAALDAWAARDHVAARDHAVARDHAAVRAAEDAHLATWETALAGRDGITTARSPDPTGNPIARLAVRIDPARAGASAWEVAAALAEGAPPVIVRDEFLEHGRFELDPCNLHAREAEIVARRLGAVFDDAARGALPGRSLSALRQVALARRLAWPD